MICDAHVHVGWWEKMTDEDSFTTEPIYISPEMLCSELKRNKVGEFVFSSSSAMRPDVTIDDLLREAQEVKTRFGEGAHPFLWISYRHWKQDKKLSFLDTTLFEGVKLHELEAHWVKNHPREFEEVLSQVEMLGFPVQLHAGEDEGCRPLELLPFVQRHPTIHFDFAHFRPARDYEIVLDEAENVFTDACYWTVKEDFQWLISLGFENRLLFGSDFPVMLKFSTKSFCELYRENSDYVFSVLPSSTMERNFKRFLTRVNAR